MCEKVTVEQFGKPQDYRVDFLKFWLPRGKPKTLGLPREISRILFI